MNSAVTFFQPYVPSPPYSIGEMIIVLSSLPTWIYQPALPSTFSAFTKARRVCDPHSSLGYRPPAPEARMINPNLREIA